MGVVQLLVERSPPQQRRLPVIFAVANLLI